MTRLKLIQSLLGIFIALLFVSLLLSIDLMFTDNFSKGYVIFLIGSNIFLLSYWIRILLHLLMKERANKHGA